MLDQQDLAQALREVVELNRRTSELVTWLLARSGQASMGTSRPLAVRAVRGAATERAPSSTRLRRQPRVARPRRRSHTAAARIRDLLARNPERVWHLRDVERELPDVQEQTVRSTMGRLARKEELVGYGNGHFQIRRR